jgi:hypothetical protein
LITVSRLVGLLLRSVLLLLILRMLLLVIIVVMLKLLIISENRCYVSHLVLVTGRTRGLPPH